MNQINNSSKPKEYLYVDGYNIINHWDSLRELSETSLEESREKLMEILAEYHHYSNINIILVFDSYAVRSDRQVDRFKGIEIVYTREFETADQYIERMLDEYGRRRRIRVATSDRVEQDIILSRGGTRISARELEVEIYNATKTIRRIAKRDNNINDVEIGRLDNQIIEMLSDLKEEI
ncbi:MAG: NYN domain-containing protein [Tissierellia bacterium]|nr:NYN domain-containing protein [Tissierellia bacterium]